MAVWANRSDSLHHVTTRWTSTIPLGAEIRRLDDLEPEVPKEFRKYFLDGGAIRLDLGSRAAFPGLANSAGDRHDRWTETAR